METPAAPATTVGKHMPDAKDEKNNRDQAIANYPVHIVFLSEEVEHRRSHSQKRGVISWFLPELP